MKKESGHHFFILVLLLTLFLTPFILAIILYTKKPHYLYHNTVNNGHLILKTITLQQLNLISDKKNFSSLKQSWFLFYLTQSRCSSLCQKKLNRLRQITHALGKNRYRVRYGLINVTHRSFDPLINNDPALLHYRITLLKLNNFFSKLLIQHLKNGYFIADPRGKIILYYFPDTQAKAIYDDLNRLLNISTLG